MESFPDFIDALTPDERTALANAARKKLEEIARPPDEYGYKPAVSDEVVAVLESFADETLSG
jgi:hypothetical protein